jgi:thiomorpholine-carboxylate dehydrogenase
MSQAPLYIGENDVTKLLSPLELIPLLEQALAAYSLGARVGVSSGEVNGATGDVGVVQPVRNSVHVKRHNGFLLTMPGYVPSQEALATKIITFYPDNIGVPTHQGFVMLFDHTNGSLLALLDGGSITAIRTAVASAIATKYLACENPRILALLGSGVQARSHYEALSQLYKFEQVRIWSRSLTSAQKLASDIGAVACATVQEAVKDADVICTVTFATSPILELEWVKQGAHINAIGACRPDWAEMRSELMLASTVYCDSKEACLKESGDIILAQCEVYGEIGEVISGQKEARWQNTTVYKSVGMAVADVVSAKLVYDKFICK